MVHFLLSRRGYEQLAASTGLPPSPLWVNGDVLSDAELSDLRSRGIEVTVFFHQINSASPAEIAEAVSTIQEHHPSSVVWVEHSGAA